MPMGVVVQPVFQGHYNIPEKVSLYDRYPLITDYLTWGRYDIILRNVPDHRVSSHQCPLKTGFTVSCRAD